MYDVYTPDTRRRDSAPQRDWRPIAGLAGFLFVLILVIVALIPRGQRPLATATPATPAAPKMVAKADPIISQKAEQLPVIPIPAQPKLAEVPHEIAKAPELKQQAIAVAPPAAQSPEVSPIPQMPLSQAPVSLMAADPARQIEPVAAVPGPLAIPLPENGYAVRSFNDPEKISVCLVNPNGDDHYWVKIVDADNFQLTAGVFVRAGQSATIVLPVGRYRVKFAQGKSWFGTDRLFGDHTHCTLINRDIELRPVPGVDGASMEILNLTSDAAAATSLGWHDF